MADNDNIIQTIEGGITSLNNNISSTNSEFQQLGDNIVSAIDSLGDGLKLQVKNENTDKKEKDLKSELEGLQVFAPDIFEVINLLMNINTSIISSVDKITNKLSSFDKKDSDSTKDTTEDLEVKIDTSTTDVSDLNGLTRIEEITGTGFSILGNILTGLNELFKTVVDGLVGDNGLKQSLVGTAESVTSIEKEKENSQNNTDSNSKGVLSNFFTGLAGSFETIAGSLLMLSIAVAILSTVELNAQLLTTVLAVGTFMLTTFWILSKIQQQYAENPQIMDSTGNQVGSLSNLMKQFAIMLGLVSGTLVLCGIMVSIVKENWFNVLTGLIVVFGTAFVTLYGLSLLATSMQGLVNEESPLRTFVNLYTQLIFTVMAVAILCWALHDIIMIGLGHAFNIMLMTGVMMLGLGLTMILISKAGVTPDQIDAFKSLLIVTTVLIGILAILTIVLGIIPQEIITQGLATVGLLVGMVVVLLGMLTIGILALQKVEENKIWALMGVLIVTTLMIGILSILVIVLGNQNISVITQGLITLAVIMTIPFVVIKTMSKLAQQSSQMIQALLGIAMTAIVTLAITAVAFLVISAFSSFTVAQVLVALMAVTLTTILLIAVGGASIGLAAFTPVLISSIPLALVAIALTGVLTLAITGVAVLITSILSVEQAKAMIVTSTALTVTTLALIIIASTTILLATMALPLMISVPFALIAIQMLRTFLIGFAIQMSVTLTLITNTFSTIDPTAIGISITTIGKILVSLTALNITLLTFNVIAGILVIQVATAAIELTLLNLGMFIFVTALHGLIQIVDMLPQSKSDGKLFNVDGLTSAVQGLSELSIAVNNFTVPNPSKLLAMSLAMAFTTNFAKKLGQVGDEATVGKITNLANSLSQLASQSNGLTNLATAIKQVAEASKQIEDLPNKLGNTNLEALTGQVTTKLELLNISKPESNSNKEIEDKLSTVLTNLDTLNQHMSGIADSLSVIARDQGKQTIAKTELAYMKS